MDIDFTPSAAPRAAYSAIAPTADTAVLFLHGITGSPAAWQPIARALAADDLSVSVPLLPGHGGTWRELAATTWADWLTAAEAELRELQARHTRVVVAGLSMGGALTLALATGANPPDEIVLVNPGLHIDSPLTPLLPVLRHVVPFVPAIGNDIAHPDRDEYAGDRTPVAAVASFAAALTDLRENLWQVGTPTTVLVSGQDSVVGPRSLRVLRSRLGVRPGIVPLRRSRHVATLDYDADVIAEAVAAAAHRTPAPRAAGAPRSGTDSPAPGISRKR